MHDPEVTLHQLEIFRNVATAKSFTKAAQELHLSQPVVSRTVQEMERRFGVQLLERTSRQVRLTSAGEELLSVAESTLATHRSNLARFSRYLAMEQDTVTVAALPSVCSQVLSHVVQSFATIHPEIRIELRDTDVREVHELVRSGDADLGIADAHLVPAELDHRPWQADAFFALVPEGDRLGDRPVVTWEMLAERPFIALHPDTNIRHWTDLGFELAHVYPQTVRVAHDASVAAGLVAVGIGVTALPELLRQTSELPGLRWVPLDGPAIERQIEVLTARDRLLSLPAEEFRRWLFAEGGL